MNLIDGVKDSIDIVDKNKFIESMNFIGEKIGVAFDFASENIYPYIADFISRFIKYTVITKVIESVIFAIISVVVIIIIKKMVLFMIKDLKKDYSDGDSLYLIAPLIVCFAALFFLISGTYNDTVDVIKVVVVPEFYFYEYILELTGGVKK